MEAFFNSGSLLSDDSSMCQADTELASTTTKLCLQPHRTLSAQLLWGLPVEALALQKGLFLPLREAGSLPWVCGWRLWHSLIYISPAILQWKMVSYNPSYINLWKFGAEKLRHLQFYIKASTVLLNKTKCSHQCVNASELSSAPQLNKSLRCLLIRPATRIRPTLFHRMAASL